MQLPRLLEALEAAKAEHAKNPRRPVPRSEILKNREPDR
jgi:hypothetical protein